MLRTNYSCTPCSPIVVLLLVFLSALPLAAQNNIERSYQQVREQVNQEELTRLAEEWQAAYTANYARALAVARERGIAPVQVKTDGTVIVLSGITDNDVLQFDVTNNVLAAISIATDRLKTGGDLGLSLAGAGLVLGLWEAGGHPRQTHEQFAGRVTRMDTDDTTSHATHVCGTLIGDGTGNAAAEGMAPAATVLAYNSGNDASEMATEAASGLILSNHSYGSLAGWNWDPVSSIWNWYGDTTISSTESLWFGFYGNGSRDFDQTAWNAPNYLIVKSAGNDRDDAGPAPGTPHQHNGDTSRLYTDVHPADGNSGTGYDCIPNKGNAKNILTVGATNTVNGGYAGTGSVTITNFSGWGPTDDGRIKPDISADGSNLLSADVNSNTDYDTKSGTSMSAPSITGSCALLQEHYSNVNGSFMRAATLKGLLIHTADEAGPAPGPDYSFGWGLMNTATAAELISKESLGVCSITEIPILNNTSFNLDVEASGCTPLVVTICWTDFPGTNNPAGVDNTAIKLVNDLDIRVSRNSDTWSPYLLDPANPANAATTGDNIRDNVEKIVIPNPVPGTYTVSISHKGTLTPLILNSSLIISGLSPNPPLSGSATVTSAYNGSDVSCFGSTDGSISAQGIAGVPPYSYTWSINGNTKTGQAQSNVGAGTYSVTITDQANCSFTTSVTVENPPLLEVDAFSTTDYNGFDISCFGENDGAVQADVTGGSGNISYLWSNGGTSPFQTNLSAGTYTVNVQDQNGCTAQGAVTLSEPLLLETTATATSDYNGYNVSCAGGADGVAEVYPTGGTGVYSYSWSNGATTTQNSGLMAGTFTVTVTDNNGCTAEASVTLTEPDPLVANDLPSPTVYYYDPAIACTDLEVTGVGGGVPPYQITWSTGFAGNPATLCMAARTDVVTTESYVATITDANGCVLDLPTEVCYVDIRCPAGNSQQTKVYICHSPPGQPGNGKTLCVSLNALSTHLNHGDEVFECDWVSPCTGNETRYAKSWAEELAAMQEEGTPRIKAYPNPFQQQLTVELLLPETDRIQVTLFTATGEQVALLFQGTVLADQVHQVTWSDAALAAGIYHVRITGVNMMPRSLPVVLVR